MTETYIDGLMGEAEEGLRALLDGRMGKEEYLALGGERVAVAAGEPCLCRWRANPLTGLPEIEVTAGDGGRYRLEMRESNGSLEWRCPDMDERDMAAMLGLLCLSMDRIALP